MTIAGGIMGALFHRERTGEATTVDVSLLGTGIWSMGAAIALSLQLERAVDRAAAGGRPRGNPLVAQLPHEGRPVRGAVLPPGRPSTGPRRARSSADPSWPTDERFADTASITANAAARHDLVAEAFAERTARRVARAARADSPASGRSCRTRSRPPPIRRPSPTATSSDCVTAEGTPFQLAAAPVQYGDEPAPADRAPEFNEHGDAILDGLGPRLGRDHRPQGPRRRRLTREAVGRADARIPTRRWWSSAHLGEASRNRSASEANLERTDLCATDDAGRQRCRQRRRRSADRDPDAHELAEVAAHDLGDVVLRQAGRQVVDVAARLGEALRVREVGPEQDVVDAHEVDQLAEVVLVERARRRRCA